MTLAEFKKEFQTQYDMSSFGAPELNSYEMSYFLTQAVRDLVKSIYQNFEHTEFIKRGLGPLISEQPLALLNGEDYFKGIVVKEALLPVDLDYIVQENVLLSNTPGDTEVISEDLDNINKSMKNSFRRPNKRRVFRTQIGSNKVRLYASDEIAKYKIKYIKRHKPIILNDFATDPDLMGDETIEGRNKKTTTELPTFLHDGIVKKAVILAIKAFRENNLQTQVNIN